MDAVMLHIASAFVTGLLVGNELAVAFFVHPAISALPDAAHASAARALARTLGRFMPFWYALALVLLIGEVVAHRPLGQLPGVLCVASAALVTFCIVGTISMMVPINNRIARMDLEMLPSTWKRDRRTWDRFHAARVVLLVAAFLCLLVALLR